MKRGLINSGECKRNEFIGLMLFEKLKYPSAP